MFLDQWSQVLSANKIFVAWRTVRGERQTRYRGVIRMVPLLRIGLFPYLNVQPVIHGLRDQGDVELVIDVPSRIADRFRAGELDVAMVPSFEAATLHASVLDGVCIASDGPVETVILHHRVPLHRVRSVALDEASRTSAALVKILITEASGEAPNCVHFSPHDTTGPDADAILVIGDPAFTFARDGFKRLDLGEVWRARYSIPFVYAVMVKAKSVTVSGLSARMRKAVHRGLADASSIAHSYNSGVDATRALRYMRHVIRYDLAQPEKEGLALFHRLAKANGLLPEVRELQFHAI